MHDTHGSKGGLPGSLQKIQLHTRTPGVNLPPRQQAEGTSARGAGLNKPLTLVMTDVEGSTELWEWDRVVMMEAITLHDRIMRASLAK